MASSKSSLALVALFAFGMFRSTILSPGPAVPRRSALVPADGGKPQVHRVEGLTYLIDYVICTFNNLIVEMHCMFTTKTQKLTVNWKSDPLGKAIFLRLTIH